jgi:Ca-activated chloride channel family protein
VSPVLIVVVVFVGLVVAVYLFGLGPEPKRGRRQPGVLKRRSKLRRWLPVLPLLGAIGCLALALSGFRFNLSETAPITMLVLDVSDSMNQTDVSDDPSLTRLSAAEDAAAQLLDRLPPEFLVGLATFADEARVVVAPTVDRGAVVSALGSLTTERETHIGDGLDAALDAIEAARGGGQAPAAAVLLSDGKDTGSLVTPHAAAERAMEMAVPVSTVVLGQEASGADPATLEDVARTSDGATFTADSADELTRRFTTIGSQLSVDLHVRESATPLVVGAIVLVIVAGFLLVLGPR